MEENLNSVDYSSFLENLQNSNLDIYDKVQEILNYFKDKDEQEQKEKEQQAKEQEQQAKEQSEEIDYNSLMYQELQQISKQTEYNKNLEYLESINNLLISAILILGIILGVMSFNSLARFFK